MQRADGQNSNENQLQNFSYELKQRNFREGYQTLTEDQIAGSPYLNRQFTESVIVRTDHSVLKNISLRYNIFANRMEFKEKETVLYIPDPYTISRIQIGNQIFVYALYMTSKTVKASYFQLLTEGNYQLLKMYKVTFKNSDVKADIHDSPRFENQEPSYYFRYRDGMAHLISSQKELIKILQPVHEEVIDYIRSNKINARNQSQLIDLMNFTEKVMK